MSTDNEMNGTKRFGSEYFTPEESAYLQHVLAKQLGPEWVSQRPGPAGAGKMVYVEGHTIINLANKLFGFNGWSSEIRKMETDYIDLLDSGKYSICISVVMRITLKDGTFHEDIGVGFIDNCKSKAMGIQKAKKEAVTDATKRAIRYFGSVMGNCIHDKAYMRDIVRIAPPIKRLDVNSLYRESASGTSTPPPVNIPPTNAPPYAPAINANPAAPAPSARNHNPYQNQQAPQRNDTSSNPPTAPQNGQPSSSSADKGVQAVRIAAAEVVTNSETAKREWQEDSFNGYDDDNSFLEQLAEADFDYVDGEMLLEGNEGPANGLPQKRLKLEE